MIVQTPQDILRLTQTITGPKLLELYSVVNEFLANAPTDPDAGVLFHALELHSTPKLGARWRMGRRDSERRGPFQSLQEFADALRTCAVSQWLREEPVLHLHVVEIPERDDRRWKRLVSGDDRPINARKVRFGGQFHRFEAELNDFNMRWPSWRDDLQSLAN